MSQFVRLLFPSFLLVGIAVALFCFAPFSGGDKVEESLVFEAQLSAPADGELRLYSMRDGAGSPREFSSCAVKAGAQQPARMVIPPGTYRAFRLVLSEQPERVEIAGARIVDLAGVELARIERERFHAAESGAEWTVACAPPLVLRSSLSWGF